MSAAPPANDDTPPFDPEALATAIEQTIAQYHDAMPQAQGESGNLATAKALGKHMAQLLYDNSEHLCRALRAARAPMPLAQALGEQLDALPSEDTPLCLEQDEVASICAVLETQHAILLQNSATQEQAAATFQEAVATLANMHVVVRMVRAFALSPLELPGAAQVKDYLREYIDHGGWGPIAWPTELHMVSKWLHDAGFINHQGSVHRPEADPRNRQ